MRRLCRSTTVLAAVVMLATCTGVTPAPAESRLHVTTYDAHIELGAKRWLTGYSWRWLRALCYQESRFYPRAVSPAGARGLCQFMPGTWNEARQALGVRNVFDARENSYAAGWYLRRQLSIWTWERTDLERLELALASYNAGAGNIIEAQRKCSGAITWAKIRSCLPAVTGRHAAETLGYVRSIKRWFEVMQCSES